MTRPILLFALLSLSCPAIAQAQIRVGVGAVEEIDDRGSYIATVSRLQQARHPWEATLGYIGSRQIRGARHVDDALFVALSKRVAWRRWFVSGGVALTDEDNEVLSSHGQFLTGIGYDFGGGAVSARHLSNAGTNGRNRGETFLLFEAGF